MSAIVKIFKVENKSYRHVMSSYHDRVDLLDEDNRMLLSYRDNEKVFDQNGRLGSLSIDFVDGMPHWAYYATDGKMIPNLGPDILTAAVELSKRYIRQLLSGVAFSAGPAITHG